MHQIKLFKGVETELDALERNVNAWLKSSDARVIDIFGNMAPQTAMVDGRGAGNAMFGAERQSGRAYGASDVFMAVLYESP